MRTYEPDKLPITFGKACEEMWSRVVFNGEPIKMMCRGLDYEMEVVMRMNSQKNIEKEVNTI